MIFGAAGQALSRSYRAPLTELFTGKGTADLGAADTGQAWQMMDNGADNARLSIINGKLTNTASNPAQTAAGYIEANIGTNVTRVGGRFTLAAGGTGGLAVFIIWKWLLNSTAAIPDCPCHLTIAADQWAYGVWQNGSIAYLDSGALSLTANDTTIYTVDCSIAGNQATLTLPGLSTIHVTDSRIASFAGPYACFETYQANAATDGKPKFVEVWANT